MPSSSLASCSPCGCGPPNKAWDDSVTTKGYELLRVSQFTLYGRLDGNKPDFSHAMPPQAARQAYAALVDRLRLQYHDRVKDGVFGP